jgi:hypothetical protein
MGKKNQSKNVGFDMSNNKKHSVITPPSSPQCVSSQPPTESLSSSSSSPPPANLSLLNFSALDQSKSPLRGFIYLFWMSIVFYGFLNCIRNYQETGSVMSWRLLNFGFSKLWTRDFFFAHIFIPLFLNCTLVYLCSQRVKRSFGKILMIDCGILFAGLAVSIFLEFRILQSLAYSLHLIAVIMKIHSVLDYFRVMDPQPARLDELYLLWFMMTPTIVFSPNLPTSEKFNFFELGERISGIFLGWFISHLTIEHYIYPIIERSIEVSFLQSLCSLFFPFLITCLILFLTFFEHLLGLFALVTGYGDRKFYSDWWNCITFEEFARTWNLPVHYFIKKHIYDPQVHQLGIKKRRAVLYTFLLSSLLHEIVVQVALRKPTWPFLFGFQMLQLPSTWIVKVVRKRVSPILLNMIFWSMMIVGPPLIILLYAQTFY